jgi:hypothetical protein
MSARDKREADGRLVEAKVGVWKICMAMWAVYCRFRESQEMYRYRADKMEQVINGAVEDSECEDQEIRQIYDNSMVDFRDPNYFGKYIGRLLLDEAFLKFIGKIPQLMTTYHDKYLKPSKLFL